MPFLRVIEQAELEAAREWLEFCRNNPLDVKEIKDEKARTPS